MKSNNNELRSLANLAKQRLKNGGYTSQDIANAKKNSRASSYFLKNAISMKKIGLKAEFTRIADQEDQDFINKVNKLLKDNNIFFNQIGQLIDKDYYESLSEIHKQRYVLTISDRYNKIKTQYNDNLKLTS